MKRKTAFPLLCVLLCILAVGGVWLRYQHTSARRPPDRYAGQIDAPADAADADRDGVGDGEDILLGALDYVSQRPKYGSRYYAGGYPDDGFGVCTDVVAAALKAAGYDLMALVNEDIRARRDDYDIEVRDGSIDFRRVRNLKVFFAHTAAALTTDVSEIGQWQGGDVVIFEDHIGIVSDRRNRRGVPYVIHHSGPWQRAYEQDILEKRQDIVGHYRVAPPEGYPA